MSLIIDTFIVNTLDGNVSKKYVRKEDEKSDNYIDEKISLRDPPLMAKPSRRYTRRLDFMLRHSQIYKIARVIINGVYYSIGGDFYEASLLIGNIVSITYPEGGNIYFRIDTSNGLTTRNINIAEPSNSNYRSKIPSDWFAKDLDELSKKEPKKKDIEDEECLSIREVEAIIGEFEGCKGELIKFVKNKIKKNEALR